MSSRVSWVCDEECTLYSIVGGSNNSVFSSEPDLTWATYVGGGGDPARDFANDKLRLPWGSYIPLNIQLRKGETYYMAFTAVGWPTYMVINSADSPAENAEKQ